MTTLGRDKKRVGKGGPRNNSTAGKGTESEGRISGGTFERVDRGRSGWPTLASPAVQPSSSSSHPPNRTRKSSGSSSSNFKAMTNPAGRTSPPPSQDDPGQALLRYAVSTSAPFLRLWTSLPPFGLGVPCTHPPAALGAPNTGVPVGPCSHSPAWPAASLHNFFLFLFHILDTPARGGGGASLVNSHPPITPSATPCTLFALSLARRSPVFSLLPGPEGPEISREPSPSTSGPSRPDPPSFPALALRPAALVEPPTSFRPLRNTRVAHPPAVASSDPEPPGSSVASIARAGFVGKLEVHAGGRQRVVWTDSPRIGGQRRMGDWGRSSSEVEGRERGSVSDASARHPAPV